MPATFSVRTCPVGMATLGNRSGVVVTVDVAEMCAVSSAVDRRVLG
jgi:hypothetical protein